MEQSTLPPSAGDHTGRDEARAPGIVVVFTGGAPAARAIAVADDRGGIELGRNRGAPGHIDDGRVSRRHARIARDGERWLVTDLGSQNGTFVDGARIAQRAPTPLGRVVRIGDTLVIACSDIRSLAAAGVRSRDGFVRGPAMQAIVAEAGRAGRAGATLHVRGETGSGKEGVVEAFHRAGPRAAQPLIAVNCAAIPHALAERLLFGARRGAYSGIEADATGYLQEADGGTLFLDEIAELDLVVQAKLLRALESREVMPLGAPRPRRVDFALCSATNKDLRGLAATGALREDLHFRIATPAVTLPPLRDRPEEIAWLVAHALGQCAAHVSLIEQCLLRPWPGNVRELLAEVRAAAHAAGARDRVAARHLGPTAGRLFGGGATRPAALADGSGDAPAAGEPRTRIARDGHAWRQRITDALAASDGNIAAAARALGLHRTQLRRLMRRHGLLDGGPPGGDAGADSDGDSGGADDEQVLLGESIS